MAASAGTIARRLQRWLSSKSFFSHCVCECPSLLWFRTLAREFKLTEHLVAVPSNEDGYTPWYNGCLHPNYFAHKARLWRRGLPEFRICNVLATAGDVEAHVAGKGRIFLIDLQRFLVRSPFPSGQAFFVPNHFPLLFLCCLVQPPTVPEPETQEYLVHHFRSARFAPFASKCACMSALNLARCLLADRPEFMRSRCPEPVSSDVWSSWGSHVSQSLIALVSLAADSLCRVRARPTRVAERVSARDQRSSRRRRAACRHHRCTLARPGTNLSLPVD